MGGRTDKGLGVLQYYFRLMEKMKDKSTFFYQIFIIRNSLHSFYNG